MRDFPGGPFLFGRSAGFGGTVFCFNEVASGKSGESFLPPRVIIRAKEPAVEFLACQSLGNGLKVRPDFLQLFRFEEKLACLDVFKDPLSYILSRDCEGIRPARRRSLPHWRDHAQRHRLRRLPISMNSLVGVSGAVPESAPARLRDLITPDGRLPSFESSVILLFCQAFHSAGGDVLDPTDALGNRLIQSCGCHHAFHQTTSQLQAFFRRQFERKA